MDNIIVESLTNQINGATNTFTINPQGEVLGVYWNGQEQIDGINYTISSNTTLTMLTDAPKTPDKLLIKYLKITTITETNTDKPTTIWVGIESELPPSPRDPNALYFIKE